MNQSIKHITAFPAIIRSLVNRFVVFMALISMYRPAVACSTYKITDSSRTVLGCNHDTWFLTPRIWFETNGYGAGFTGARFDGSNGYAPQSGMNEFGLAFTRLAAATPKQGSVAAHKKVITNPTFFLKELLHNCKTVDEVKEVIDQYDHSVFIQDVLLYVDRSGRYLIVEPYTTSLGNNAQYVLSNFCPSQVSDLKEIKQERYVNGVAFLKNNTVSTNPDFCRKLSDTMHVCREKVGDGTLLTSVWDLNAGVVRLYFYHDYNHEVTFDLKKELSKGDHILEVPSLFPPNKEFAKLANFKTPITSTAVDFMLKICFVFFIFSALFFLVSYFIRKQKKQYRYLKLLLVLLSLVLAYYMFLLDTTVDIFYFAAPYKDYKFSLLNIAAYIPFLVLFIIVPVLIANIKILRFKTWSFLPRWILTCNTIAYCLLSVLFFYWGLYGIFISF